VEPGDADQQEVGLGVRRLLEREAQVDLRLRLERLDDLAIARVFFLFQERGFSRRRWAQPASTG
jgi:hypothetical protein